ncbi:MAG: pyridoxamine 5'-phosphate oxidase family protein [Planctomycetota bacterium]|nr:pyridoxamine 5'-phosphate oxidase family protein [Planctomycetota bacterium]MDE2216141.1 pyridoxamine 5'-phosphate oxidase family protein [Planctomycetota bacterium]
MRRKDKEITDKTEIEDILSTAMVGRLGTCANGIPYITPVNFTYDREASKIFLHCANEGRKLDNIRINQNVCFEVEEVTNVLVKQPTCASSVAYRSVILFGRIKILTDLNAKNEALQKLADKYAPLNPKVPFTDAMLNKTNVLEIEIKEMTAKRSPVKPAITDPAKK